MTTARTRKLAPHVDPLALIPLPLLVGPVVDAEVVLLLQAGIHAQLPGSLSNLASLGELDGS